MKFETRGMSVVPLIVIYIVVFATAKLYFIISIVSTECVDKSFVVDGWEESFFRWHWGSNTQLAVLVLKIAVPSAVCS